MVAAMMAPCSVKANGGNRGIAMLSSGTGRNLRPVQGLDLGAGEAEHEILWKPLGVRLTCSLRRLVVTP